MSVFPTTSTHLVDLKWTRYDLAQLDKQVRDSLKTTAATPSTISSSTPSKGLFHLHTLTLDVNLLSPTEGFAYARQYRPNPEYEVYIDLRDTITQSVDSLIPITVQAPTRRLLRPNPLMGTKEMNQHVRDRFDGPDSIFLYLPTSHNRRPLAWFPALPDQAAKEWSPHSTAWDLQHWLCAAAALDPSGTHTRKTPYKDNLDRFHLETKVDVMWVPGEDGGTELKLLLTVDVMVEFDNLFMPLIDVGMDMFGLVMHSLMPAPVTPHLSESEARAEALRHFFDCLQPAPDHSPSFDVSQLQPEQMTCQLLPFQKRTLALLLGREGSALVEEKKPIIGDPRGFWSVWDLQKFGRIAYRRSTGTLVKLEALKVDRKGKRKAEEDSEPVDGLHPQDREKLSGVLNLSAVKGTMLCEEMGLGKTVEAIALTLLHRHPLSNRRADAHEDADNLDNILQVDQPVPTIDFDGGIPGLDEPTIHDWIKAEKLAFQGKVLWDEQSKLHISDVAATLIVAPPSLLNQWVAEIRQHCPYLRICVYPGWKALQNIVDRHRNAAVTAHKRAQRHRSAGDTFINQTVRKYQKLNDRQRVKREHMPDQSSDEDSENEIQFQGSTTEAYGEPESSLQICHRLFVDYVRAHDIVLTTYGDLANDLKVALPAPPRSRRSTANYQFGERPRSPLMMVEWWRVIMDEVQLQSDQSNAAIMVSHIPRIHALAVSGTPARTDVSDLIGSLKFLQVPLLSHDARLWHRLQQPTMRESFTGVFQTIAVRTTKKAVSGEFHLPAQSRMVVPIELSEIELHYYNDTLDRQKDMLDLPIDPREPRPEGWKLDAATFRSCLRNLRQICTHIQVGQMQQVGGRVLHPQRLHLGKELMTMSEALQKMRDDQALDVLVESRSQMRAMVRKAQLLVIEPSDDQKRTSALHLYQTTRDKIQRQLGPLREHYEKLLAERGQADDFHDTPPRTTSQHEKEKMLQLRSAADNVREHLLVEHQTWFFEGDLHHIMKNEEQEVECYSRAEAVRKELLSRPLANANKSIGDIQNALNRSQALIDVRQLHAPDTEFRGGLITGTLAEQANELLKIMNGSAELLFAWRAKIIELLSSRIDPEAETLPEGQGQEVVEPEKEQYAQALEAQGEVEAYLIAYAAVLADRKEFMLEDKRNLLAEHDARTKKQRTTKAAAIAGKVAAEEVVGDVEEQATLLMSERQAFRDARVEKDCQRPLKGIQVDLGAAALSSERLEEQAIAKVMIDKLRLFIKAQSERLEKLNKELELFRSTFNKRVIYFAALQEISDYVQAPKFKNLNVEIREAQTIITNLEVRLAHMMVKSRFLQYLGSKDKEDSQLREDCIICMGSSDDERGVILGCGHFFCQSCYREYRRASRGAANCPSCREEIEEKAIRRVKIDGEEEEILPEDKAAINKALGNKPASRLAESSLEGDTIEMERKRQEAALDKLKYLDLEKRREIAHLDMMGEYGSKVDFLIKHLLWYKAKEPDARHVIFSNWSDSLNIGMQAMKNNGISFVSFDSGAKMKDAVEKFKQDPSITAFLLHAERESSGLTLTSCRIVHLLEPVLKHSFELQAIGRVDRLGQKQETTVYCYATKNTVESRILSQGVRNGTSIYLEDETGDEVVADMPNVVGPARKGGDVVNDGNEEELLKLLL